jgi:hypothetical protein
MPPDLAEPWRGFLTDLDRLVGHDVRLHCCGGFVVTMLYGLARTTADLDVLSILPTEDQWSRALTDRSSRQVVTTTRYSTFVSRTILDLKGAAQGPEPSKASS